MAIVYSEARSRGRKAGLVEYEFARPQRISRTVGGKAAQVSTITVDTASASTAYTLSLAGETVTVTSDGSTSAAEIAEQIKDAINQDSNLGGIVVATRSSGVVTVTAINKGESFAISDSDANLTTATTTSASSGDTIPFGIAVFQDLSNAGEAKLGDDTTVIPAKVMTWTPSVANSTLYTAHITMRTGAYAGQTFQAEYTSDGTATAKEIVEGLNTAINAALPASTVACTEDDTKLTLTSEIAGDDFYFAANPVGGVVTVTPGLTRFLGVSERLDKQATADSGAASHAAGDTFAVVTRGFVWVLVEESPTLNSDIAFIRRTAGAGEQAGAFRVTADSTDCFALPPGRVRWASASETGSDGNTIALLELL